MSRARAVVQDWRAALRAQLSAQDALGLIGAALVGIGVGASVLFALVLMMPVARAADGAAAADIEAPRDAAPSWWLSTGGVSHHFHRAPNGDKYNGLNAGAGVRVRLNDAWALEAGTYRNSIRARSTYALARYTPLAIHVPFGVGPVRLGLLAGAVDGYSVREGGFTPVVLPVLAWEGERVSVQLLATPKWGDKSATLALQFALRVW